MNASPHHLDAPDAARSDLEGTNDEPVERTTRMPATESRLRHLLAANRAVVEELDLEAVLRRITEAATDLVGAQFGALGVISLDGHLEQFVHVGISEMDAQVIGHLPEGHGLLGAVIESGEPIRLAELGADNRSTGFPAHHPPMGAFLGVPIRVRSEVYGNLYLTNPESGEFTAEDEDLVTALAATAGIAIANARLFDEARRRQRWSSALADVTSALLSGESDDILDLLAERVASVVDADLVCVIVADAQGGRLRIDATSGGLAGGLRGRRFDDAGGITGRVVSRGRAVSIAAQPADEEFPGQPELGPTVALPLIDVGRPMGALVVSRAPGGSRFTTSDLALASDFAAQASVALEVARGRAGRQRLSMIEDRSRIARDLHDHVIQRLFASGLAMQSLSASAPDHVRAGLEQQVDMIDEAIAEIRTAVFALTSRARPSDSSLRHRVLDTVGEASGTLAAAPRLTFSGPLDLLVVGDLADDVVAVVRESLSNVARHAQATRTAVDVVVADGWVKVTVQDDGVGIGAERPTASGTRNLETRALRRGGSFEAISPPDGGTRVTWRAPLISPASSDSSASSGVAASSDSGVP